MINYKYDIAISLCQQDIGYAQKLYDELNSNLKVFFYENHQHELITKSGPEVFGSIFKLEARVVVILSRNEWSESFYTDIERNAILDRISIKNEGYNFLFVIPMEPNQIPVWYPPTRIYADPRRFSIENMARFIEFKVTELGGEVKPLMFEDKCNDFYQKIELKKELVKLQQTSIAIESAKMELQKIRTLFNDKIEFLKKNNLFPSFCTPFQSNSSNASFSIDNFWLECEIFDIENKIGAKAFSTQDFFIQFVIRKKSYDTWNDYMDSKKIHFYYSDIFIGWAIATEIQNPRPHQIPLLFRTRNSQYPLDLGEIITSEALIETWFSKLFELGSENLNTLL